MSVQKISKGNGITVAAVTLSSNTNLAGTFVQATPYLSVSTYEKSIVIAVSNYQTLNGFYVEYKFPTVPKNSRAWHGAAKSVALEVVRILKRLDVQKVILSPMKNQDFTDVEKSAILKIKDSGIEVA